MTVVALFFSRRLPHITTRRLAPLLAALPFCLPHSGVAQVVEGRVIDAQTQEPVAQAYVALVTEDQRSLVGSTADSDGSFSLEAPAPGSYFLYASAFGYRRVSDGIFDLGVDGRIELEVRLQPDPVMMDSIRAAVDRTDRYLRDVGFYERRERGWGYHLTQEEIRERAVATVVDAIRDIPRVFVAGEGFAEAVPKIGHEYPNIVIREGSRFCAPHIFVDGMLLHRGGGGDPAMPDEFVHPDDIAGMEVYRSKAEAPIQYAIPGGCGVLVIWTWHG